jgi:hypothetical protein
MPAVRVELPFHLRTLANLTTHEVTLALPPDPTITTLLDALEAACPTLRGTIREHGTGNRRAYLRFFACQQDISFAPHNTPLPSCVIEGREPFLILGAVSGG